MTDAAMRTDQLKVDPESLVLRAKPRGVTRFKRHVVIGVAAIVSVAVSAAAWLALSAPALHVRTNGQELYNVDRKSTADGLAALPATYDKMKPPNLGPALPGDLGPPILSAQRGLGAAPADGANFEDAARADKMHVAQLARQAKEGGVFFQVASNDHGVAGALAGPGGPQSGPVDGAGVLADRLTLDPTRDQNAQGRKLDFVNQQDGRAIYNPHAIQDPVSPFEVMAGTLISASLITGLDSDLPGLVVAQVTQNVYDTVTGGMLLIPQGSRLIGTYDSVIAFGQSRALVVWQRIIMPDGSSIQIDNLPATDPQGYSGLADDVDYHTWALLKGVAISTLLGIGTQLSLGGTQQGDLISAIRQSTQDSLNQAGQQITQKNLNIQPTIKVRPGWPLRVIVHKDLVLRPYRG
jgi:type IV secretory pathway VirB10-like protein